MRPESPYFYQVVSVTNTAGPQGIEQKGPKDEIRESYESLVGLSMSQKQKQVLDLTFPLIWTMGSSVSHFGRNLPICSIGIKIPLCPIYIR